MAATVGSSEDAEFTEQIITQMNERLLHEE